MIFQIFRRSQGENRRVSTQKDPINSQQSAHSSQREVVEELNPRTILEENPVRGINLPRTAKKSTKKAGTKKTNETGTKTQKK